MVRAVPARQTGRQGRPGEAGGAYRTDLLAAELRGHKGQGAAMAHLIIVHRNDEEIIVNADHIIVSPSLDPPTPTSC